jgi:hypothetical protein
MVSEGQHAPGNPAGSQRPDVILPGCLLSSCHGIQSLLHIAACPALHTLHRTAATHRCTMNTLLSAPPGPEALAAAAAGTSSVMSRGQGRPVMCLWLHASTWQRHSSCREQEPEVVWRCCLTMQLSRGASWQVYHSRRTCSHSEARVVEVLPRAARAKNRTRQEAWHSPVWPCNQACLP